MFINEIEKFKSTVEDTIKAFFNYTPEEVKDEIKMLEGIYSKKYDLEKVEYINVPPDTRDVLLRYRTLKYFDSVWTKTKELYDFLKIGVENGH